jgi:serine/threonine-protein kinase
VALLVAGGAVAVYEASGDGHSSGGQSSEDHTGSGAPSGSPGAARPTAPVARQADAGTAGPADALPASWSAWVAAPAPPAALTGGLRAARLGDGTELVFGTDADGGVRYLSRTASGFAGWTRLTGIHVVGEPAPVALSGNRLRLFALGTDGLLYQRTLTGGRTGGWTPWGQVDGRTHYDAPPAAASPDGSTVVLVGRIAGDLVTSTATDGDWTAPATVPTAGRITGTPALIADGRGRVDAFVQPAGGGEVRRLTAVDGVWNAAQTLRGLPGGARAEAVSAPSGALWVLSGGNVAVSSRHPGVSGTGGAWRIGRLPAQAAGPGAVAAVSDRSGVTVFAPTAQGSVAYATST